MRKDLIKYLIEDCNLIERFPGHKIYKWGTYGEPGASDLDIVFVGEISKNVALDIRDIWLNADVGLDLDITILPDHTLFNHIDRFNECKDDLYFFNETIIRYKLWPLSNNDVHGRIIEDKGVYWKVTQMFANKAFKYKDKGWPKPILLKDYV